MCSLIIAVNYKTDDHAAQLARSLACYSNQDLAIVLVDNSERDDPEAFARMIHEVNPDIQCVRPPANLGYFGGANFGLKQYLVDFPLPQWVIICNVDIEFRDPGFFATLRQLEATGGIGVVAPRIWSAFFLICSSDEYWIDEIHFGVSASSRYTSFVRPWASVLAP